MPHLRLAAALVAVAALLTGCLGPATGATPEPTAPAAAPTIENPIAGPSGDTGEPAKPGQPSPSLEVPPPAY
jgi:hypothetical protein